MKNIGLSSNQAFIIFTSTQPQYFSSLTHYTTHEHWSQLNLLLSPSWAVSVSALGLALLAIHLPLNFMLISLMCFVLSCLFYLPAAVSVSNSAVMSPITGHAAPVTINCCLTSTHSIPLSLLMLCCCLPVLCC